MFKKIISLIEKLDFRKNEQILWSPTRTEVRRELMETPELRVVINPKTQEYFLADADKFVHWNIEKEAKIEHQANIQGWLYSDGAFIVRGYSVNNVMGGFPEEDERINFIKNTKFYKELDGLIDFIEIQ